MRVQAAWRAVWRFLAILGVLACLPALLGSARNLLLRHSGEPQRVVLVRSWLSHDTATSFTFYRSGRPHASTLTRSHAELALLGPATVAPAQPRTPELPSPYFEERAQQAVAVIMARVKASAPAVPAGAPRFVRDDLTVAVYPGREFTGKQFLGELLLEEDYARVFPPQTLPLAALGLGLLALALLLRRLAGKKPAAAPHFPVQAGAALAPDEDGHIRSPVVTLTVKRVRPWEEYNEIEGDIVAEWQGRDDCFYLQFYGDEWQTLRPGQALPAQVWFECGGTLEVSADGAGWMPGLTRVSGVNYTLCARVVQREDEWLRCDLPLPLLVDLDHCPRPATPLAPGCFLRASGALQARIVGG